MNRYEYDEHASHALLVDAALAADDGSEPAARRLEAMRRLNRINDPFARQVLTLHRDCGTGSGVCDHDIPTGTVPVGWGCETTALIAHQFGVAFPQPDALAVEVAR